MITFASHFGALFHLTTILKIINMNRSTKILFSFLFFLLCLGAVNSDLISFGKTDTDTSLSEEMIGRWSFDNASNIGQNIANQQYGAKLTKPYRIVPGVSGNAIELSPKANSGASVTIPPEALPEGLKAFTFSLWIAPKTLHGNVTLIRKEDAGNFNGNQLHGGNRLLLDIKNDGQFLSFGVSCGGNYAECMAPVSSAELCDGRWHLASAVFDGQTMRVYLDGIEIGSRVRGAPLSTIYDFMPLNSWRDEVAHSAYKTLAAVTIQPAPFYIGSSSGKGDFFNGKIDDVRFHSKALDGRQIASLYAEGCSQLPEKKINAVKKAETVYQKGYSFIETLALTGTRLKNAGTDDFDEFAAVEIQRLLRKDFPEETGAYIEKWQKNPVNNLLLNDRERVDRIAIIAPAAFEYMPLTPLQWSVLPEDEHLKWEKVKKIHDSFDPQTLVWIGQNPPLQELFELEDLIHERPRISEPVAKYTKPETPETLTRTDEEAQQVIENDWLFQCNDKPTIARTLQEIAWTHRLLDRLSTDNHEIVQKLKDIEKQAKAKNADTEDRDLYFATRRIKREVMFQNPVIDFNSLVYIDNPNPSGGEWNHETRHRLGYQAVPGGRLLIQHGLGPEARMTRLMPEEPLHGSFWRPDLSYDGKRVVFSFKPHNEKTFHLYEIGVDGKNLRQLTGGIFDDLDPIYLPDGKNIIFLTTRGHIYVRCMPPTNAFITARMPLDTRPGDKNLYLLSRSGEPEYSPSVLDDGRVIYTRWEYTDKPLWRAQSLWTMTQNGEMVQTFWGNQSVWPDLLKDARQIPGTDRVMFTGSAHHNWFMGSIGIITPAEGYNFPNGLTKVTADVAWPETGNGPIDPLENPYYHASGEYTAYYSPYPLSEDVFIVSAFRKKDRKFVLLLMDTEGNREIMNEGSFNIWYAQPLRARNVPAVTPDHVAWPSFAERDNPQPGKLYSNNVYDGAPEALKDKAKYLRIWIIEHKTYTYWHKRNYISTGPEISAVQSEGVKKIIGTVPVEEDGSVNFVAPSGLALHFQLLDENQRALQTMRSFTGVQPGESRGCIGCHESHSRAVKVADRGIALKRSSSHITPVPWKDISVGYERYVQPALDRYCASCHADPSHKACKAFNSKLRPGFLGFKEPYMTLLGSPTWGSPYKNREDSCGGGFGWADIMMIEAFDQRDPVAYSTPEPMTRMSYKSRLVDLMADGKHHGVKVDPENLLRVILWVDAMGPYYGTEELLQMEDPVFQGVEWLSQKPRVKTAPIVPRPGPFDPFFTDEAYAEPNEDKYNILPLCVQR